MKETVNDIGEYIVKLTGYQVNLIFQSLMLAEKNGIISDAEKKQAANYIKNGVVDDDTCNLIRQALHNDCAVLRSNKVALTGNPSHRLLREYYEKREQLIFEILLLL